MRLLFALALFAFFFFGCCSQAQPSDETPADAPSPPVVPSRASKIPLDVMKITPSADAHPPELHSDEWEEPVPVSGLVNTAGAEDSPFVTPDGNTLYFFFTPDVRVPVEKQVLDGVTGIWVSRKQNGVWGEPERVVLQDVGRLSLDGCEFVQGNHMLFCSAREGYTGVHWFSAEFRNGLWQDWRNSDFEPNYKVGELHVSSDGQQLFFHSDRPGGKGGLDIWVSEKANEVWQEPVNLNAVNSPTNEGWPFVSEDGSELWISKDYGIWRSKNLNGEWTAPELVISSLAGEASLDREGNIYFVHHFFKNDVMLEADIYVAFKKP